MTPHINTIFGLLFIAFGAVAVLIMLDLRGYTKDRNINSKLIIAHKIFGYLFLTVFVFMTFVMIYKISDYQEALTPRITLHVIMGIILIPMIILKILIVRRYKKLSADLLSLGKTIFLTAFTLSLITTGYYYLHKSDIRYISISDFDTDMLDENIGRVILQGKCGKCHTLERAFKSFKSKDDWTKTVNRMAELDYPNIRDFDAKQIINYLLIQQDKRKKEKHLESKSEKNINKTGEMIVSQKCTICHDLERVYNTSKSKKEWSDTINRMVDNMDDPEFLTKIEKDEILFYLSNLDIN